MEVMANSITERLCARLAEDLGRSFSDNSSLVNRVARALSGQLSTINARVSRLQQQQ